MANRMTTKAADQLMQAVDAVQVHLDQGDDPTEAVVKVARAMELPHEMIRLVANAHNVAQQTAMHKSADRLIDRLAEHPLADGQAAIDAVFGSKQASPADAVRGTAVAAVYNRPPAKQAMSFGTGAIPALKPRTPSIAPTGTATGAKVRTALTQSKMAKQAVDDAWAATYAARDRMLASLNKVANYFLRQPDRLGAFLAADHFAEDVLGAQARPVLDYAATKLDDGRNAVKRASATPYTGGLVEAHRDVAPYSLIADAIEAGEAWVEAGLKHAELRDGLSDKVAGLLAPFDYVMHDRPNILPGHAELRTKSSNLMQGMLGGAAASTLSDGITSTRIGKPVADLTADARGEFESASHANNLRKIDAQVLLHDMMNNDETLSGYDPQEVLGAYNQLSEIGPRLATQSLTIRPLMHKMMAQGGKLDPHDVEQIINLDNQLARRELPKTAIWDSPSPILA